MHTSPQTLSTTQEHRLFAQLVTLLTDITAPDTMKEFLQLFFTDTEQSVFSKRLAILFLLDQGKSYEEISQELKVSSATISTIAALKEQPIMQKILKLIKRDQQLRGFLGISL